jgi:pSer/pThr/pTyr-binding forkhead associated (FHA) protein
MTGFGEEAATLAVGRIPQLEVTGGPAAGRIFPLTGAQMVIGRAPTCDICLADTTVSRKHAILWNDQGSWCIADQGSTSGTIVNGQRVQSARLSRGDVIILGAITLTLTG